MIQPFTEFFNLQESLFSDWVKTNPKELSDLIKTHGPVESWSESLKHKILTKVHGLDKPTTDKDNSDYHTAWSKGAYFK
jgi:hypothetical protein